MGIFDIFRRRAAEQKKEKAVTAERTIGEILNAVLAGEYNTAKKADELLLTLRQLDMPLERFEEIVSLAENLRAIQAQVGSDADFAAEMNVAVDHVAALRNEVDALTQRLKAAKGELSGMQEMVQSRGFTRSALKEQIIEAEATIRKLLAGEAVAPQKRNPFRDNRSIYEISAAPLPPVHA